MSIDKLKSIDKRVENTKNRLSHALLELIAEKGYDAITTQNIIERAGIGKSTFYAHFENKDQLLLAGKISVLQILEGHNEDGILDFKYLYRHAAAHFHFSKGVLETQAWPLIDNHLQTLIKQKILTSRKDIVTESTAIMAGAAAAAVVKMLYDWLCNGMPIPLADMAENSQRIIESVMNVRSG
jgi:hypothetical protein